MSALTRRLTLPLAGGRYDDKSLVIALAGLVLMTVGAFLSWCYNPNVLGNLTLTGNPGAVQIYLLGFVVVGIVLALISRGPLGRLKPYVNVVHGMLALGLWSLAFMVLVLAVIAVQAGGLVNADPGAWISLTGTIVVVGAAALGQTEKTQDMIQLRLAGWAEILVIVVGLAIVLFAAAYALGLNDAATFVLFLVLVAGLATAFARMEFFTWLGIIAAHHRTELLLASFLAAFAFPFTQSGSNANMSIATQVIIFAATAMGLNIVVGLAGLLDLGYIAFLGAGAYTGAILSHSAFATIDWKPPFLVVMLCGGLISAVFGLIIGSPTLRVSGDYLAIVTLAFGEIFRFAMFNLDGNNGPNLTHGPNGIPAIPELQLGSFDFGASHTIFGVVIPRFANYYFLLLVLIGFIILVFSRLNASRIGRGWIAIREDEKAAEAMGVNTFGLKVFAFAGGAFLAGLAGTIKAHHDVSVTPDQYQFLESAFLLAAVVLGGMGTVGGVLVGAVILKLLPEKLRFFSEFRLLLFGLLLVLMMRYRPEGLVANRRRQLEFHEDDEELADDVESIHIEKVS